MNQNLIRILILAPLFAVAFLLGTFVATRARSAPFALASPTPSASHATPFSSVHLKQRTVLPSPYHRDFGTLEVSDCRVVPFEEVRSEFVSGEEADRDPRGYIECPADTFRFDLLRDPNPTFNVCECRHVPHGAGAS